MGFEGDAVVLQHRDDAPAGVLIDALVAGGFTPTTVRVDRGQSLPGPEAVKIAVALGNDSSAADLSRPWVLTELDWLRRADRAGTPILGIGFGAQALAVALGGAVQPALRPRHGWVWVASSSPESVPSGPWLAWDEEVIRLPPRAQLVAHDRVGPQAFRAGGHLGVQFHPEVTPQIVADWVANRPRNSLDAQGILEVTSREYATASAAARRLFSTFVSTVRQPR